MSDAAPDESRGRQQPLVPRNRAWEALVEQRIQQAQLAGQFDQLPGLGKPLEDLGDPGDENWWLRRKLREEGVSVLPASLEILKDIERTVEGLDRIRDEGEVRKTLVALNERIRKANYASSSGPPSTALPLDVERAVERWRERVLK